MKLHVTLVPARADRKFKSKGPNSGEEQWNSLSVHSPQLSLSDWNISWARMKNIWGEASEELKVTSLQLLHYCNTLECNTTVPLILLLHRLQKQRFGNKPHGSMTQIIFHLPLQFCDVLPLISLALLLLLQSCTSRGQQRYLFIEKKNIPDYDTCRRPFTGWKKKKKGVIRGRRGRRQWFPICL